MSMALYGQVNYPEHETGYFFVDINSPYINYAHKSMQKCRFISRTGQAQLRRAGLCHQDIIFFLKCINKFMCFERFYAVYFYINILVYAEILIYGVILCFQAKCT